MEGGSDYGGELCAVVCVEDCATAVCSSELYQVDTIVAVDTNEDMSSTDARDDGSGIKACLGARSRRTWTVV